MMNGYLLWGVSVDEATMLMRDIGPERRPGTGDRVRKKAFETRPMTSQVFAMNPEIMELTDKAMKDNAAILHALEEYDRKEKTSTPRPDAGGNR